MIHVGIDSVDYEKIQALIKAVHAVIGSQDDNIPMPKEYHEADMVAVSRSTMEVLHDAVLDVEKTS